MKLIQSLLITLLLISGICCSTFRLRAQSTDNPDQPFNLFLPLVSSGNEAATADTGFVSDEPLHPDEAFVEPEVNADSVTSSAVTAVTTLLPVAYTTTSGAAGGQPVSNLHVQDQSGTQNEWNKYVEFTTPGSQKYIGYRSYTLPATIAPTAITALQVKANYLGAVKSYQTWTWTLYNWSTNKWVKLGNNNGALAWQWKLFTFNAGGTLRNYVNTTTREIRVRLQSNNTKDDMDLDYEAVLITANTTPPPVGELKILIPLYNYPNWYQPASYRWDEVAAANSRVPIVAIINPNDGPDGGPPNSDYVHGLDDLRTASVTMIGYVSTVYGDRDINLVKADIDLYATHYNINGIFLDETASGADKLNYYTTLYQYIKSKPGLTQVVLNPGTQIIESYISQPAGDTAVIFENGSGWPAYVPDAYVQNYPANRFSMLAYGVANAATMRDYVNLARARNVGYVYVTNDGGANPWDTLPSYWTALIDYVAQLNGVR